MNSNPFIHPFAYPVILDALFKSDGASQAAFAPRVIGSSPESTNEIVQLAITQFNSGAVDQAVALLAKILTEQPNHPAALFYSGRALVQGGRINEAKHWLDVLVKTAPRDNLYLDPARELLAAIDGVPMGMVPAGNRSTGA